jgi:hypothetical protein
MPDEFVEEYFPIVDVPIKLDPNYQRTIGVDPDSGRTGCQGDRVSGETCLLVVIYTFDVLYNDRKLGELTANRNQRMPISEIGVISNRVLEAGNAIPEFNWSEIYITITRNSIIAAEEHGEAIEFHTGDVYSVNRDDFLTLQTRSWEGDFSIHALGVLQRGQEATGLQITSESKMTATENDGIGMGWTLFLLLFCFVVAFGVYKQIKKGEIGKMKKMEY